MRWCTCVCVRARVWLVVRCVYVGVWVSACRYGCVHAHVRALARMCVRACDGMWGWVWLYVCLSLWGCVHARVWLCACEGMGKCMREWEPVWLCVRTCVFPERFFTLIQIVVLWSYHWIMERFELSSVLSFNWIRTFWSRAAVLLRLSPTMPVWCICQWIANNVRLLIWSEMKMVCLKCCDSLNTSLH